MAATGSQEPAAGPRGQIKPNWSQCCDPFFQYSKRQFVGVSNRVHGRWFFADVAKLLQHHVYVIMTFDLSHVPEPASNKWEGLEVVDVGKLRL